MSVCLLVRLSVFLDVSFTIIQYDMVVPQPKVDDCLPIGYCVVWAGTE